MVLIVSIFIFRIAIWNRNMFVSLIAVGVWLGGLTLDIQRTFCILSCCTITACPMPALSKDWQR